MEELERKERDRREKKLHKQLEKQQKKLQAKGIHVDMDTLRKDYDHQKSGGKGALQFDAYKMDEEIDVVGIDAISEDAASNDFSSPASALSPSVAAAQRIKTDFPSEPLPLPSTVKRKMTPFSIENLLCSRVQQERMRILQMKEEDAEEEEDVAESKSHHISMTMEDENKNNTSSWHKPSEDEDEMDSSISNQEKQDLSERAVLPLPLPLPLLLPPTHQIHRPMPVVSPPSPLALGFLGGNSAMAMAMAHHISNFLPPPPPLPPATSSSTQRGAAPPTSSSPPSVSH
jgi:hypothetical protein